KKQDTNAKDSRDTRGNGPWQKQQRREQNPGYQGASNHGEYTAIKIGMRNELFTRAHTAFPPIGEKTGKGIGIPVVTDDHLGTVVERDVRAGAVTKMKVIHIPGK